MAEAPMAERIGREDAQNSQNGKRLPGHRTPGSRTTTKDEDEHEGWLYASTSNLF
jgi:hypothetical protein